MNKIKQGEQVSLDTFSEHTDDEILEAFEKQVRPRRIKNTTFQPQIALPSYEDGDSTSIDLDEFDRNHLLYPCYEATKIPLGKERDAHCNTCPTCIAMRDKMDSIFLKNNKWLDGSYKEGIGVNKKVEEPEWKI